MTTAPTKGPTGYENWKAALAGEKALGAFEVQLYSDASISNELADDSRCPYAILNAIGGLPSGAATHVLTMRVREHLPGERPDLSKTDTSRYHGGRLTDEISALISLCMGVRLKPGTSTRTFEEGDAVGRPRAEWEAPMMLTRPGRRHWIVVPRAIRTRDVRQAVERYFARYPAMKPEDAIALVRAARLYQDAIWIAESQPHLTWLFLVAALEVVAINHQSSTTEAITIMETAIPAVARSLRQAGGDELAAKIATELHPFFKATARFINFVIDHMPPPPPDRPDANCFPIDWSSSSMKKALGQIYAYRSRALHDGTPFPFPMCESPLHGDFYFEAPSGLASGAYEGTWLKADLPMLLATFEYIARNAILNWWLKV